MGAPWADDTPDEAPVDVLRLHNPDATFTTRGCPRACPFCAVPRIEGKFRELRKGGPRRSYVTTTYSLRRNGTSSV